MISSDDIRFLEAGVLLPVEVVADADALARSEQEAYLASRAGLILMPTERCNFRCSYCYETFEKGRMSPETEGRVLRLISARAAESPIFSLSWFGGEPLIAPDIVLRLSSHFRECQTRYSSSGTITITTNGYSRSAMVQLLPVRVDLYQISLDGPSEIHNRSRTLASGAPTYQTILDNIEFLLAETDADVILRANVDSRDRDAARVTEAWVVDELLPRFRRFGSRLVLRAVARWDATTTSVDGICIRNVQEFQNWALVEEAMNGGGEAELARALSVTGSLACYAGLPHVHVLGSDGAVYKCSVAFDLPSNQIGHIVEDGSLKLDRAKELLWTGPGVLSDAQCQSCAFGSACLGVHCPLVRIQTGDNPCPTEKVFLGVGRGVSEAAAQVEPVARRKMKVLQ